MKKSTVFICLKKKRRYFFANKSMRAILDKMEQNEHMCNR